MFLFFSLNIPFVSAQSEAAEQPSVAVQEVDPITAAEQALVMGRGAEAAPVPAGSGGASIWVVIRMLLVLVLVAAAIYALVFFIKKAARRSDTQDPYLKVLASAHLGGGRYAHVVSLGTKAWLVGVSDGGVNLISEVADQDVLNAMLLADSAKSAAGSPGRALDFKAILGRFGLNVKAGQPDAGNIRKRRERIKGW